MAIRNKISTILGERRESISDFARNTGISYPTAHDLYHAKSKAISFELMNKICNYLQVGPSELFPWTPDNFQSGIQEILLVQSKTP